MQKVIGNATNVSPPQSAPTANPATSRDLNSRKAPPMVSAVVAQSSSGNSSGAATSQFDINSLMMAAALMAQKSLSNSNSSSKMSFKLSGDKENAATNGSGDDHDKIDEDEDESDSNYMNKLRQAKPVIMNDGGCGEENSTEAGFDESPAVVDKPRFDDSQLQIGAKKRKRQFISSVNQQFQVISFMLFFFVLFLALFY